MPSSSKAAAEARSPLDEHEADSVMTVAGLHHAHDAQASVVERLIDSLTDALGRPVATLLTVVGLCLLVAAAAIQSHGQMTGPLAAWLEILATLAALLLALVILASQRRSDQFAARRAALTLELAVLADKKNAKIIELLRALHEGSGEGDREANQMSTPVDTEAVSKAIDASVDAGGGNV